MLRLDAGVVPLAVVLGKDDEDDVRRRAAIALGQIKHTAALASLHVAMLNDASSEVRREATHSWTTIQRHVGWRR
jgi:vesicle coat complex subunit